MSLMALFSPSQIEQLRFLISTGLSYGVVGGAVALKMPQIATILKHNSAVGISLLSNCFELTAYVISTSWGISQALNFKDYGENVFILLQMGILLLLVGKLQAKLHASLAVLGVEASVLYALSTGRVSRSSHEWLLSLQILCGISSRVPQILLNHKRKSTGQLSFATFFLAFGGGVARLLTVYLNVPWEKGKLTMLAQFGVAVTLNLIIILQILLYRRRPPVSRSLARAAKQT